MLHLLKHINQPDLSAFWQLSQQYTFKDIKRKKIVFKENRLNFGSINIYYPPGLTTEHNTLCKYINIILKRKYFDFSKPSAAFLNYWQ